jgi:hypothetical protein
MIMHVCGSVGVSRVLCVSRRVYCVCVWCVGGVWCGVVGSWVVGSWGRGVVGGSPPKKYRVRKMMVNNGAPPVPNRISTVCAFSLAVIIVVGIYVLQWWAN